MNIKTVQLQEGGYLINGSMNQIGFGTASVPNDEGNRDYQDIQEWIAEGNTPDPEFTQAEIDDSDQKIINVDSREYLSSTDWYVIRFQETAVAVPQEISDAREAARLAIV